jgi:hypothetical protein
VLRLHQPLDVLKDLVQHLCFLFSAVAVLVVNAGLGLLILGLLFGGLLWKLSAGRARSFRHFFRRTLQLFVQAGTN